MDLADSAPGGLEQSFTTFKGQTYHVTFDMAGHIGGAPVVKNMKVEVDTTPVQSADFQFDTTGFRAQNMGWASKCWYFVADSTLTTLRFTSTDATGEGALIDNVTVVEEGLSLIKNGSFEVGPAVHGGGYLTLSAPGNIPDWKVVQDSVDIVDSVLWDASDQRRCIDMEGSNPGGVEQTILTDPGEANGVVFDLSGHPGAPNVKGLRVQVNTTAPQLADFQFTRPVGHSGRNMGWKT